MKGSRGRAWLEGAVVLAFFEAFAFFSHHRYVVHGLHWGDPAMLFHFGRKLLVEGALPFRDYVFQIGPLPIYTDALFQKVLGSTYTSSLWASLTTKSVLALVTYFLARDFAGRVAGVLLGMFLIVDQVFQFQHHWSTSYALLFGLLGILFFVRAHELPARKGAMLVASGASIGLIVTARQSGAMAVTALLVVVTLALAIQWPQFMDRRALGRFWGGFAAAIAAFAALLAAQGALRPAVQQMFFDAAEKKGLQGIDPVLDALSGGGLFHAERPYHGGLGGFLLFNGAPLLLTGLILLALRRRSADAGGVMLGLLAAGVALTALSRSWFLGGLDDLPRVFGMVALVLVLAAPRVARRMLGIEPPIAAIILAVPLGLAFALEMSYRGRGWVDASSLMALALLVGLASRRISTGKKTLVAGILAFAGVLNCATLASRGFNPFARDDSFEGTLADTRFPVRSPVATGMLVDESNALVTEWFQNRVRPGDTCFVYGTASMLYDILDCKNPSGLDITIADFFTVEDGKRTLAQLRNAPPEWIIAAAEHWTNPDLDRATTDELFWSGPNGAAAKELHRGLREILADYVEAGQSWQALPTALVPQADKHIEKPARFRLYHRRAAVR